MMLEKCTGFQDKNQQFQPLGHQKPKEIDSIPFTHASSHPWTMMIMSSNTSTTISAMFRSQWLIHLTNLTPSQPRDRCRRRGRRDLALLLLKPTRLRGPHVGRRFDVRFGSCLQAVAAQLSEADDLSHRLGRCAQKKQRCVFPSFTPLKINMLNPKMEVWKKMFFSNWVIFLGSSG